MPTPPAITSSAALWLRADAGLFQDSGGITPAVANNDPVGLWTDQSASGYSPIQATAGNRGVLLTNPGFHGMPGVQFSGGKYLSLASGANLTQSQAHCTLICAFRQDGAASGAVFSTTQDQMSLADGGAGFATQYINSAAGEHADFQFLKSTAGGQLYSAIYDGTQSTDATKLVVFRNLANDTLTRTGTPFPATLFAGGSALYIGRIAAGGGSSFTLMELIFWKSSLSSSDRQAVEQYLAIKYFTNSLSGLVACGDSITHGTPNNIANPWPLRCYNDLGWTGTYNNLGVAGLIMASIAGEGTVSGALYRDDWLQRQPITLIAGINDLVQNNVSAATLEGYYTTWVTNRHKQRYTVFQSTIMPASTCTGTNETTRQTVNTWILAKNSGADFVIDVAGDARMSNPANTTYYESDGVHPTSAGDDVIAGLFMNAFQQAGYQGGVAAILMGM